MQNTLYWKPQCDAFQDRFTILTYDARAQGQSDRGRQNLSLDGHAADLAALLEHLAIEKAFLAGVSHGAKIALAHGVTRPDQVNGLVLCSVGASPTCRSRLFVRSWLHILDALGMEAMVWAALPVVLGERFLSQKKTIYESMVGAVVQRNTKEALCAHLEAVGSYPPLSQLAAHVRQPTLVISGSEDPLVTKEGAIELAALCHGHHVHFSGVGHSVPGEVPALFNETLLRFVNHEQSNG